jgi:orotate phosphoribosyltransferase
MVMGAVPIVSVVSARSYYTDHRIPAFFVRKELKGHGTNKLIEGYLKPGTKVMFVDDVTTTGGSVMRAIQAARNIGCHVDKVITVVDRLEGAKENLAREGIELIPLFTRRDFEE